MSVNDIPLPVVVMGPSHINWGSSVFPATDDNLRIVEMMQLQKQSFRDAVKDAEHRCMKALSNLSAELSQ